MSKENGYLQLRRGVFEHIRDGRMSLADYAIHSYITSQADTRTGVWNGSAGALAGELSLSTRQARRFLERLSHGDYIKRFPIPGRHVCYPILVHKFAVTGGEHRGEQLNAIASISPVDLRYFPGEHMSEQRGEHVSSQKILETRDKRKSQNPAAKNPPPADLRFQPFVDYAHESYTAKHGAKPLWQGKDYKALQALLQGHSPEPLPLERLKALWEYFAASTEPFTAKQGDSLAYFCTNLDKFVAGPILKNIGGKPDASTLEQRNLAAAGFRPN